MALEQRYVKKEQDIPYSKDSCGIKINRCCRRNVTQIRQVSSTYRLTVGIAPAVLIALNISLRWSAPRLAVASGGEWRPTLSPAVPAYRRSRRGGGTMTNE